MLSYAEQEQRLLLSTTAPAGGEVLRIQRARRAYFCYARVSARLPVLRKAEQGQRNGTAPAARSGYVRLSLLLCAYHSCYALITLATRDRAHSRIARVRTLVRRTSKAGEAPERSSAQALQDLRSCNSIDFSKLYFFSNLIYWRTAGLEPATSSLEG